MSAGFVLYSRAGCVLCEEMLTELAAISDLGEYTIDVIDVDADAISRRRFGHKVPVLLLEGDLVCHGRLNPDEVYKAIAYHRRPV